MKIDGTSVTLSRQKNELYQFCIANSYAILYKSLFEKCYYQFARKITINLCAKISHFMRKATTAVLVDFGLGLDGIGLAAQSANAQNACKRLNQRIAALEAELSKKGKLFESLGVLAGLSLALLVI